ncbi:MAG: carbohydrate ABC transporter permease [Oscillospiraceae bacterium]|nr:carbohydrate ABC transporter permease [Oscillospiraceae bacterium]
MSERKKSRLFVSKPNEGSPMTQLLLSLLVLVLTCIIIYPFLYCVAFSLSDNVAVMTKNVTIFPVGFTTSNFQEVLQQNLIINSFLVSVARTVCGILWTLLLTGLAAYASTRADLPGRRLLTLILIIPMFISGGLIPTYVLMFRLRLFNSFLVYIVPHGFWAFNMLLMRTYFQTIPESLAESARLDGAGEIRILIFIIAPLCMPIIAVISMFSGVWQWNAWFDAMLYVTKPDLKPLQAVLQQLIMSSFASTMAIAESSGNITLDRKSSPEAIRMATLVFTTLPIVCIYPFFQKHFVRGVMIGAVKA